MKESDESLIRRHDPACFVVKRLHCLVDSKPVKNEDKSRYTLSIQPDGNQIILGMMPDKGPLPPALTMGDCFDKKQREMYGDFSHAMRLGPNPFYKVCRQYKGVDLTEYSPEYKECFPKENGLYLHPWLAHDPSQKCISLINAIKKDQ